MRSAALVRRKPIDFHTSNIQRARTKRLALCIVRLGNPIRRPPEGRSLRDAPSVNGIQKQNVFSGASALFRTPAPLFSPFFSGKTEKNGPPEAFCTVGAEKIGHRRYPAPFRRKKACIRRAKKNRRRTSLRRLAGDEGFEPPQTESESGVLPLHKSPICTLRQNASIIILRFAKMSRLISSVLQKLR
jgi:hypothetical protein